jgi:hypothetical protein
MIRKADANNKMAAPQKGQADDPSATGGSSGTSALEITDSMVSAGVEALARNEEKAITSEVLVSEVFLAMVRARVPSKVLIGCEPSCRDGGDKH